MPTIVYVASILVCFHGECTRFESAPYSKDVSAVSCTQMLQYTFQTQVGPHYDELINFDVDKPEDVKIIYSGCDKTKRTPETSNEWYLEHNVDPTPYMNQNDLRWQQEQEQHVK